MQEKITTPIEEQELYLYTKQEQSLEHDVQQEIRNKFRNKNKEFKNRDGINLIEMCFRKRSGKIG